MLSLRFVGLLILLLTAQVWCKPAKGSESADYTEDDTPSEYIDDDNNDDTDDLADDVNDTASAVDDDTASAVEEPQIISRPESIRIRNGSTIYLHCLVKNADNFAVTWKKDDNFMYHQVGKRIVILPNNTLVIHDANVNDTSDDYECSIMHPKKTITIKHRVQVVSQVPPTQRVDVTSERPQVLPTVTQRTDAASERPQVPPSIHHKQSEIRVTPGKRVEVNAGDNVTLGCETRIQPTPEIKWYHENERVHNNIFVSGNRITIMNINRHDGGHYQCLAENGMESPPVEAINVIVNYAPEIETKGKWMHTGVGVESRLSCIVHAHPHANVTWYKDQKRILPKKNSIELRGNKTRYFLDILHTQLEDLANYTCVAENKLGRTEKTISLTGLPSQAIISGGEMTRTASGLILKWHLESYSPIIEYKLQYRRKEDPEWIIVKPTVTNGRGNQFIVEHTIEGLQPGSYEAIVMARNDFGWSLPSKPHTFVGEYADEQAENVRGPSAGVSQPALAIATLFLVVSSCAFTSL